MNCTLIQNGLYEMKLFQKPAFLHQAYKSNNPYHQRKSSLLMLCQRLHGTWTHHYLFFRNFAKFVAIPLRFVVDAPEHILSAKYK